MDLMKTVGLKSVTFLSNAAMTSSTRISKEKKQEENKQLVFCIFNFTYPIK